MAAEAGVVSGPCAERATSSLWWLPLVLGIGWVVLTLTVLPVDVVAVKSIAVVLGVLLLLAALHQTDSYSGRSSALLVSWVALGAFGKGVKSIVTAFELRPPTTPQVVSPAWLSAPERRTRGFQTSAML